MTLAHLVDKLAMIIAFGVPILLIWRWRLGGAVAGAVVTWLIMSIIGPILSWLDPGRDNAMLDSLTVYFAPVFAVGYCGFILICVFLIKSALRRRRAGLPSGAAPSSPP
ncbi:MAG: hypothetical protein IT450_23260 [Phycisphaerales bacterium]|nr:hypothetical protein [Phycisphaerales bacterium]